MKGFISDYCPSEKINLHASLRWLQISSKPGVNVVLDVLFSISVAVSSTSNRLHLFWNLLVNQLIQVEFCFDILSALEGNQNLISWWLEGRESFRPLMWAVLSGIQSEVRLKHRARRPPDVHFALTCIYIFMDQVSGDTSDFIPRVNSFIIL